jgi:hypothetical protein
MIGKLQLRCPACPQFRRRRRRCERQQEPGAALGVATFLASANPAGLNISSGMKVYGEESGGSTHEGRAKATAKEIAAVLKPRFQQKGWIH